MGEPLPVRCAAESVGRDEALVGTASTVRRWLLVEQPGAWGRTAPVDSHLDPSIAHRLDRAARDAGVRVLLIRRPRAAPGASPVDEEVRRVYLAHSGPEHRWMEEMELPAAGLDALAEVDLRALDGEEPPGLGRPAAGQVHLVCTNGRHDPCCADLGRPVVRALVDAGAPGVWESSHVGGDRFAANVVSLPDGTYYGRLQPATVAGVLARHRDGLLDLGHYRGRSCHPPAVQVAEAAARRALDERRMDAVRVTGVRGDLRRDGALTVVVEGDGGRHVEVDVGRSRAGVQQLTCHAAEPQAPWVHHVVAVR